MAEVLQGTFDSVITSAPVIQGKANHKIGNAFTPP
jgi:hypothetical protein